MRRSHAIFLAGAALVAGLPLAGDQPALVTEAVNVVDHGKSSSAATTPANKGTAVHDGEYLRTGPSSRAEMKLPTTSITRLGANTIFNYSVETNTIDLQAGTVLFCKPKDAGQLNLRTTAISAAILGTTGFLSVSGEGKKKVYRLGIIEGHANAQAVGRNIPVGPGDILEIRPGGRPFVFAYDVPRFVKSSPLLNKFHSTLPNEKNIEAELDNYRDEVSRGFITPPHAGIDYAGEVPVLSGPAYDSAAVSSGASGAPAGQPHGSNSSQGSGKLY